tara:strand:+ start:80 stop:679 length:600 start_codon:yes stop_codon:yes gene_type:complete
MSKFLYLEILMKLFQEKDYQLKNNVIKRINDFEVNPKDKNSLLKDTIIHYCGECEDQNELPKLEDFYFDEYINVVCSTNCICSQSIKHIYRIEHKPSGLKFNIGRNCFENLYGKKHLDDINFFKPFCKNCMREKVKSQRNIFEKEGFCSLKCKNIYNKKSFCQLCDKKFWKIKDNHKICKACWKQQFYGNIENKGKYVI